jgi:D-alanine-D-alanine ligase
MQKRRIVVLFDTDAPPPADQDFSKQLQSSDEAEFDVARALLGKGYEVVCIGFRDDPAALVELLRKTQPEAVFNLTEGFRGVPELDYAVTSVLEMLGLRYTGAPAAGMILARDKALSKKVLAYHGIKVPQFAVYKRGQINGRPSDLRFPLIVKPLAQDASIGIAQSSVIKNDDALRERVEFVHDRLGNDAIVEELIHGRELYCGVLGDPPRALPIVEMLFEKEVREEVKIATFKAKWSAKYRKTKGITNVLASEIAAEVVAKVQETVVTTYRLLQLRDYGRIDIRLAPDNEVYVIEANPNPFIAKDEDLPNAAAAAGLKYDDFVAEIAEAALNRKD